MSGRRERGARSAARGQGLVEFALVFPVFMLLLFGLIDGGRLVYQHSVLSQAAREGARLASVEASWLGKADPGCGQPGGPGCPATVAALKNDVLAAVNRMIAPFGSIAATELHIRCDPSGGTPTSSWTGTSCDSSATGNVVSVRVESMFSPLTPVFSSFGIPLSGSASMVIN